eukprot:350747-Chlamydomonas_euryale.AAC.12
MDVRARQCGWIDGCEGTAMWMDGRPHAIGTECTTRNVHARHESNMHAAHGSNTLFRARCCACAENACGHACKQGREHLCQHMQRLHLLWEGAHGRARGRGQTCVAPGADVSTAMARERRGACRFGLCER